MESESYAQRGAEQSKLQLPLESVPAHQSDLKTEDSYQEASSTDTDVTSEESGKVKDDFDPFYKYLSDFPLSQNLTEKGRNKSCVVPMFLDQMHIRCS